MVRGLSKEPFLSDAERMKHLRKVESELARLKADYDRTREIMDLLVKKFEGHTHETLGAFGNETLPPKKGQIPPDRSPELKSLDAWVEEIDQKIREEYPDLPMSKTSSSPKFGEDIHMEPEEMETYVARIKKVIEWFPGVTLGLPRAVGKTESILQLVHEKHGGNAAVIFPSVMLAEIARRRYEEAYPNDEKPYFTEDPKRLRGMRRRPIYVDEVWYVTELRRDEIAGLGWPVMARIGTSSL